MKLLSHVAHCKLNIQTPIPKILVELIIAVRPLACAKTTKVKRHYIRTLGARFKGVVAWKCFWNLATVLLG